MRKTELRPARLPMIGRRQLRLAALAALKGAALNVRGVAVDIRCPGDWNIPADRLPALVVRTAHESKNSFNRGMPEYTTVCALEVKAVIAARTAEQAQDDIETLWYAIECALFYDYALIGMLQQFASVETALDIRAEGARHIAGMAASFAAEFPEMYDPTRGEPPAAVWPVIPPETVPLDEMGVTVDLTNRFDPTGTYDDPPFPDAVTPAPRTSGPDGRAEGELDMPLQGDES